MMEKMAYGAKMAKKKNSFYTLVLMLFGRLNKEHVRVIKSGLTAFHYLASLNNVGKELLRCDYCARVYEARHFQTKYLAFSLNCFIL
jgi:hypothetical protein